MRQTIAFQATGFDCSPVQVEIDENGEPPDPASLPVALLAFESGPNVVLTLPLATSDAENMMNAFTQAEPYRQEIPDAGNWEPQPSGLPEGLFWALQPSVVGVSVTPPPKPRARPIRRGSRPSTIACTAPAKMASCARSMWRCRRCRSIPRRHLLSTPSAPALQS